MSAISRKNINTLIDKFLRKPSEFRNYSKSQISTLKQLTILKNIQFDSTVDDYVFLSYLEKILGINYYTVDLYEQYRKKVVNPLLSAKNTIRVKTNVIYNDNIRNFFELCAARDKKIKMSNYSRMVFVIYCKNEELMSLLPFDKREFTIDELFTLCSNGEIVIIDNIVIPENMSNIEIERAIREKRLILNPANINCINKDCKIHADYIECKNDFDKKIWYLIYNNFISYLRFEVITANKEAKNDELTNLNVLFNDIVNHLTEIITGIETKYKKSKKKIPTEIQNIIIEIKQLLTQAQEEFDKDTQLSSEIIDIPLQKKANTQ